MILVIDIETGGTDETESPILQIGATWLDGGGTFFMETRSNDRDFIHPAALKVNGIAPDAIDHPDRTLDTAAVAQLIGWVKARVLHEPRCVKLAGWNVQFDFRFLCDAIKRAGMSVYDTPLSGQLLDLHSVLLMDLMRRGKTADHEWGSKHLLRNADAAAAMLGVEVEQRPHNALNGAKWARAVAWKLIGNTPTADNGQS